MSSAKAPPPPPLDQKAIFYMCLLALQFGIQPILTRRFTPQGITRSTVILTQEVLKFGIAALMLRASGSTKNALKDWSIGTWLAVAFVPAALYAVQNICALTAYQNLDALTFNVLNQTKTLSAALCCYIVMRRRQSRMQVLALVLLLLSALVMEGVLSLDLLLGKDEGADDETEDASASEWDARHFTHGVTPILMASFISGLAGALSQKNLQSHGRNPYLFSMELCAGSVLILTASLVASHDGQRIREFGFWDGWTLHTLIPIVTNSVGGIIVGLVTKHAGSVRKGFALIFGILLSGIIQSTVQVDETISREHVVGGVLAAVSLYLHSTNPPAPTVSDAKKKE